MLKFLFELFSNQTESAETKNEAIFSDTSILEMEEAFIIGENTILYQHVIEAIFNEDSNNDHIGGSIILKTLTGRGIWAEDYDVKRYRFSKDATQKMKAIFNTIKSNGTATDKLSVNDDLFRNAYFSRPVFS